MYFENIQVKYGDLSGWSVVQHSKAARSKKDLRGISITSVSHNQ